MIFFKHKKEQRKPEPIEIPPVKILSTYLKMKDEDILDVLKFRYTNNMVAHLVAPNETREQIKGRVLELGDLIDCIENSGEQLLLARDYAEKHESRNKFLNPIKEKILGFIKHKPTSEQQ